MEAFNDVLNISYNSASSWNVNQSFFLVLNLNITFKTGQFRGRSEISEFDGRSLEIYGLDLDLIPWLLKKDENRKIRMIISFTVKDDSNSYLGLYP